MLFCYARLTMKVSGVVLSWVAWWTVVHIFGRNRVSESQIQHCNAPDSPRDFSWSWHHDAYINVLDT